MKKIEKQVKDNVLKFISNPDFFSKLIAEKPKEDDLIILNNSFFHRQEETNKNSKYIAFTLTLKNKLKELFVFQGFRVNSDFKVVSSKATNYTKTPLAQGLKDELKALGKLVFILIAEINDQIKVTESFNAPLIDAVNFDTSLSKVSLQGTTLNIFDTNDEELIWTTVSAHFASNPDFPTSENAMRIELLNVIERIDSKSI